MKRIAAAMMLTLVAVPALAQQTLSGDKEVTWVAGIGLGGQRLVIVPDLDLIMMTTSGAYGSPRQGNAALEIMYRFVMPAVQVR